MTSPLKRRIHRAHDMHIRTAIRLTIMEDRLTILEASNRRVVKKRTASKKQITYVGSLQSLEEIQRVVVGNEGAMRYISPVDAAIEAAIRPGFEPPRGSKPWTREPTLHWGGSNLPNLEPTLTLHGTSFTTLKANLTTLICINFRSLTPLGWIKLMMHFFFLQLFRQLKAMSLNTPST